MNPTAARYVNYILYGVMIFLIIRIIMMQRRTRKNQELIEAVQSVNDEDVFFDKIDTLIKHLEDKKEEEFIVKAKIVKLWGLVYHNKFDEFDKLLPEIDANKLIVQKEGKPVDIELNEDSFFYLYIAIPEMLEAKNRTDLRKKLEAKTAEYDSLLNMHLVKAISYALRQYYNHEGDRGLSFYEKVLSGDYGEYTYAKSLIGMYKSILNAQAAKLYLEKNDQEKFNNCMELLRDFKETSVGLRWLNDLGLTSYIKDEEEEEDK